MVPNLAPGKKLPLSRSKLHFSDNQMSVDEVQRLTGLSFFPGGGVDTSQKGNLCSNLFSGT